MTDETTRTPEPEERSAPAETGWPATPAPSWGEPEEPVEASEEPELDAWLEAQDTGWAEQEPPEHEVAAGTAAYDEPQPVSVAPLEEEPTEPEPEPVPAEPQPTLVEEPVAEPAVDEPVEAHGSDQGAAAVAGAALFSPVPAEVVAPEPAPEPEPVPSAVEEPAAEPEPAPAAQEEQAAAPAVPGERPARALVAVLAVLVLLLAGLTAFLAERSVSTRAGGGVEDARHDGLQAARSAARVVFSYDYRHLDKDFAAGRALTTGAFAKQYATTTPKLVEVAKAYKAVVVADVSDAAVITASTSKVVLLVFVNQQSSSTLAAAPKITQSRVTMTVQHRSGRWLVSDVHAF